MPMFDSVSPVCALPLLDSVCVLPLFNSVCPNACVIV